jgi:hypothetical protein
MGGLAFSLPHGSMLLEVRGVSTSVAEPHHFYAAPGKNFDAAPDPAALAPTLL